MKSDAIYMKFAVRSNWRPGDKIIAVDGQDATGKDPEAINNILRGFPGTSVELTIRRPGKEEDFNINLVRGEVQVPNVPYHGVVSDDIGYVALTTFTREAPAWRATLVSVSWKIRKRVVERAGPQGHHL